MEQQTLPEMLRCRPALLFLFDKQKASSQPLVEIDLQHCD